MNIIDALALKPSGADLVHRLQQDVRRIALQVLEHVRATFPEYTDHTISHSDGVLRILDRIMPDELKEALNEWEVYFLIAAVYLHDIGMVETCPPIADTTEWNAYKASFAENHKDTGLTQLELDNFAKKEFIRDSHHLRSEEYIRANGNELGLQATSTQAEWQIIGRIASGHRKRDLSNIELFGPIPFRDVFVRRDLLAAYLRLADELDLTAHRTPLAEFHILPVLTTESSLEWSKHLSISGVATENGNIIIGGECQDHSVYLRLLQLHQDLDSKLKEIRSSLPHPYSTGDGFHVADPVPYHSVLLKIEHVGFLPITISFQLQDREIMQLIMGERLYGDQSAVIRELLQNSVDACRLAAESRPRTWEPLIEIQIDHDNRTLTVSDNGIGMDEFVVREYFAKVGFSYYQSGAFDGNFVPISQFGIGFLSSFMVANRVTIETLKFGSPSLRLEINSLTDSFVPKRGTKCTPGTSVCLHLSDSSDTLSINWGDRVRYFARHLQIPVMLCEGTEASHLVSQERLTPIFENVFVPAEFGTVKNDLRSRWESGEATQWSANLKRADVEMTVVLWEDFAANSFKSFPLVYDIPRLALFQEGFPVDGLRRHALLDHGGALLAINITGAQRFPLTVDRTRLAGENSQLLLQLQDMRAELILQIGESQGSLKTTGDWWRFFSRYFSDSLRRDLSDEVSSRLQDAIASKGRVCVLEQGQVSCLLAEEISSKDRYWIPWAHHHELFEIVRDRIESGMALLAAPLAMGFHAYNDNPLAEIYGSVGRKKVEDIFEEAGITFSEGELLGQSVRFFSSGTPTNSWCHILTLGVDDVGLPGHGLEMVFDSNHPLTLAVREVPMDKMSLAETALSRELFRSSIGSFGRTELEVQTLQEELISALSESALLPPGFLSCGSGGNSPSCPSSIQKDEAAEV